MRLSDIITENNGDSICPGRVALMLGVVTFVFLAICDVLLHGKGFDAASFGTGYGALTGGGLAGIWMKSKTDQS